MPSQFNIRIRNDTGPHHLDGYYFTFQLLDKREYKPEVIFNQGLRLLDLYKDPALFRWYVDEEHCGSEYGYLEVVDAKGGNVPPYIQLIDTIGIFGVWSWADGRESKVTHKPECDPDSGIWYLTHRMYESHAKKYSPRQFIFCDSYPGGWFYLDWPKLSGCNTFSFEVVPVT